MKNGTAPSPKPSLMPVMGHSALNSFGPDHANARMKDSTPIVLFDGDCGFCSKTVVFVSLRDPLGRFRFAPLQSGRARAALNTAGVREVNSETVVLLDAGKVYTKSTAALRIAKELRWPWSYLAVALLIPRPIRDFVYDIVARNRHRLSPPGDRCILPEEVASRLVDADG